MGRLNSVEPRLPVADLERSFRFYTETLGFGGDLTEVATGFVIVRRDAVTIQLVRADVHHPSGKFTVWISVDDAVREHGSLSAEADIEWGPEEFDYGRTEFAILDPDGHRLIFSSPTGKSAVR